MKIKYKASIEPAVAHAAGTTNARATQKAKGHQPRQPLKKTKKMKKR
jgi:hypothetical protein